MLHNACLSFDRTEVICDYGVYCLTGAEHANPEKVVRVAAIKCKAAYDAGWYENKQWGDLLTASTELKNFQDFKSDARGR